MAKLSLKLADLDLVLIGLVGKWTHIPDWLAGALREALASQPDALLHLCQTSQTTGLLESALKQASLWGQVPRRIQAAISSANLETRLVTAAHVSQASEIDFVYSSLGITPVYLKGLISSQKYYDHSWQRFFWDIDLVVPPEQARRAFEILKEMGYVQGAYDRQKDEVALNDAACDLSNPRGYELPRLTKMVSVYCDDETAGALRDYDGLCLHMAGSTAWVATSVEVHYALEPGRLIELKTEEANLDFIPHGLCLVPETEFVYLSYKAYVDIVIFHKLRGIKLLADSIRLTEHERGRIGWDDIILRWHERGLCAPLRYLLKHAKSIYRTSLNLDSVAACKCSSDERVALDFGDYLPAIVSGSRSFDVEIS